MGDNMYDEKEFGGNSDSSRDIAYHFHSYTHPATLLKEGPHIINQGERIIIIP